MAKKNIEPIVWYCDKCESEQLMNGRKVDQDLEIHRLNKEIKKLKKYKKIYDELQVVRKLK